MELKTSTMVCSLGDRASYYYEESMYMSCLVLVRSQWTMSYTSSWLDELLNIICSSITATSLSSVRIVLDNLCIIMTPPPVPYYCRLGYDLFNTTLQYFNTIS